MKQKNENIGKLFPAHGEENISNLERADAERFASFSYPNYLASDDSYKKSEVDLDLDTSRSSAKDSS